MKRFLKYLTYAFLVFFPLGQIFRIKLAPTLAVVPQDLILGLMFLSVALGVRELKKNILENKFVLFQLLFIFVGVLSLILNQILYNDISLQVSLSYALRYTACLSLVAVGFLIKDFKNISKAILASGTAFLLLGFLQYFLFYDLRPYVFLGWDDHLYRLFSSFFDPNFAGVFYSIFLIYLAYDIVKKPFVDSYPQIFIAFFTLVAIFATYSRTALVALFVGVLTICLIKKKFKILLATFLSIIFFLTIFSDLSIEGLNPFRKVSVTNRLIALQETVQIFKKSPLIGVGFNGFRYAQVRYSIRDRIGTNLSNADAGSDNSLLFVFATTGIIGASFFIASYIWLFRYLLKLKSEIGIYFAGIVSCIVAGSLFINVLFYIPIMSFAFLLIGLRKKLS